MLFLRLAEALSLPAGFRAWAPRLTPYEEGSARSPSVNVPLASSTPEFVFFLFS
jgi:hypothetical protein